MESIEAGHIAELVLRVFEGDPWHGASVTAQLADLTADQAARRLAGHTHSIWEIVLHMTGWAEEVRRRVAGRPAQEPEGGDWPEVGAVTPAAWQTALARLGEAHRALAEAVRALPDDSLSAPVTDFREAANGTGLSRYLTLHGVVHHTVYHSGQIGLLKAALR
jgi:uncharacterized damage-inducible protein DinB